MCSATETGGACRWSTPTVGGGLGRNTAAARSANCGRRRRRAAPRAAVPRTAPPARPTAGTRRSAVGLQLDEQRRDLLVGAVLQQPGEQQVAGLEQARRSSASSTSASGSSRAALRSSSVAAMTRNSVVSSRSGVVAERREVRDEVVGDPVQGQLGDVELVLADQLQQQVERAGEVVQPDGEPAPAALPVRPVTTAALVEQGVTGRGPRGPAGGRPRARRRRRPGRDRLAGDRGLREPHRPVDHRLEHEVAERLPDPVLHLAGVQGARVEHRGQDAQDARGRG